MFIFKILLVLISVSIFTEDSESKIIVGSEFDYPPFAIVNENNEADGFSVELFKEVAKAIELEVEFRVGAWSEIRLALENGEIDALPLVSYSEERDEVFDFTMSHTVSDAVIFARKGSKLNVKSEKDLIGKKIIVMRSDATHDYLVKHNITQDIHLVKTVSRALHLLATDQNYDFAFVPKLVSIIITKDSGLANIEMVGPHILVYERGYSFAVKEGNQALLTRLNKGLSIIKESGQYNAIYDKWFKITSSKDAHIGWFYKYSIIILTISAIILCIIILLFWSIKLEIKRRTKVEQKLAKCNYELDNKVNNRTQELQKSNNELCQATEMLNILNAELLYAAEELENSRNSFQCVVEQNTIGMMVIDHSGIINFFNSAMQAQLSETKLEIGKKFNVPISCQIEVKITLSNDEIGIAEMNIVDTIWEDELAYLLTLHDITKTKNAHIASEAEKDMLSKQVKERTIELSRANAELARAARLKDEFMANMSHELRTPLNAVLTISELLTDGIYGDINQEQIKAIGHIDKSGRHLLSLINDILDLSKIQAGKMELKLKIVIIGEVCFACIQMVKQMALQKRVKIIFTCDDEVKTIMADERALKQILVNLLNNAIKFTHEKGQITLELQANIKDKILHLIVTDTGIGIPEHELENLFKPFVQINSKLSRDHEGTGLGLALVYKLAELHGGSVQVKSKIEQGSKFTVSLPWQENNLSPAIDKQKHYNTKIQIRHVSALILVAEDNETNIIAIHSGLTGYGYKVDIARDGVEAVQIAQEINPEIIIMDIQMPGMDGLTAIRQIRADKQLDKTPIIALTALAMPGDKEHCIAAGANIYLSKPVNIKQLVEEIEELLD
ncbi:MAG: transporter substrate-binding domain-containing protein [Candidatus Marithrix sp.]